MYTIGEFAAIGRLSVRMLRHYDAIGLLRPARVDEWSGYRRYAPTQLAQLNRILALKELGFALEQVARIVHDEPDEPTMRALLEARRTAARLELDAAAARLRRIEAELRRREGTPPMPTPTITIKPLPGLRIAALTRPVDALDPEHVSPVVGPLFAELSETIGQNDVSPTGPAVALYAPTEEQGPATVSAGMPIAGTTGPSQGIELRELPAIDEAATLVHHGEMATISESWSALRDWFTAHPELRPSGESREVYLRTVPSAETDWLTELQWPFTRA
jgi:DNA-binding transcriptional MerR regulator/effector-binding domain-containing protein